MTNNEIAKKILQITRTGYYEDQLDKIVKLLEASKPVSGKLPTIDWVILREKYFSDCVVKDSIDGLKLRIDYAPHDLFEWFKKEIQTALTANLY